MAEQRATRERVAVFDQTSFSLYDVSGPDALASLQWICAADVDVPVGGCVYTPFLNARGTYEADLTVTRTGPTRSCSCPARPRRSVTSTGSTATWLPGARVTVRDRTEDLSVIGVMGPRSRDLLGASSDVDWSDEAFPFATSRSVRVGGVDLRATRMTYVGEVGWELVVPMADAPAVYDALRSVGEGMLPGGLADAGYHAIESLRLEKGYRAFGRDLNPDLTPVEAGLLFATALGARSGSAKDFLGRDGARRPPRPARGPRRATPAGVVRPRRPRADGLGRRAGAARR